MAQKGYSKAKWSQMVYIDPQNTKNIQKPATLENIKFIILEK